MTADVGGPIYRITVSKPSREGRKRRSALSQKHESQKQKLNRFWLLFLAFGFRRFWLNS